MKFFLILILLCSMESFAQNMPLPSGIYEWEMVPVQKSADGLKRSFFSWPTNNFDHFEISAITLGQNKAAYPISTNKQSECLLLVKQGRLGLLINGEKQTTGSRSIVLLPNNFKLELYNAGDEELVFYAILWTIKSKVPGEMTEETAKLKVFDYEEMDFKINPKGGRRGLMRGPTSILEELEMHITTLHEGEKSHDPHMHQDEEIIVVMQGTVEEMINGTPYQLGPGSVIFLSSMDPHGIRNIGKGTCEYYAIRWK